MDDFVLLMREINKNISINSRIYGEFATRMKIGRASCRERV